jgi:hypothetical protein
MRHPFIFASYCAGEPLRIDSMYSAIPDFRNETYLYKKL